MSDPAAAITAAATVAIVVLLAVLTMSGHGAVEELQRPEPTEPEQPAEEPAPPETAAEPLDGGEWLPLSPAQRAAEIDQLRALLAASPDENVRTDLPADPGPHETA